MALFSRLSGIEAVDRDIALEFSASVRIVRHKLLSVLRMDVTDERLADQEKWQARRKYDGFLPKELLRKGFIGDALSVTKCKSILEEACAS
jgi:predicted DNA-binding transcriptional regulator